MLLYCQCSSVPYINILYDNIITRNFTESKAEQDIYIPYNYSSFGPLDFQFFEKYVKDRKMTKILEVGPGNKKFKYATHVIDHQLDKWNLSNTNVIAWDLDMDFENIPVEDNYFDFVYCRHVLEDLNYPIHAYKEITRVSKNGYIETPSPLIESLRLEFYKPLYDLSKIRGYHHHRYLLWMNQTTNTLYVLPKFPVIDHIKPTIMGDFEIEYAGIQVAIEYPVLWNTYYTWFENDNNRYYSDDGLPYEEMIYVEPKTAMPMKIIKHDIDYEYQDLHVNGGYAKNVRESIFQSIKNTNSFYITYINCLLIGSECDISKPIPPIPL